MRSGFLQVWGVRGFAAAALLVTLGALETGCVRAPCNSAYGLGGPDARFSVSSCCGVERYLWNGRFCSLVAPNSPCGCVCDGKDCNQFFTSLDACTRAHAYCAVKTELSDDAVNR